MELSNWIALGELIVAIIGIFVGVIGTKEKYSLQGTTQGNGLTGADMPVRFSM